MEFSAEIRLGPWVWGVGLTVNLWRHDKKWHEHLTLRWRFGSLESRVWLWGWGNSYGYEVSHFNPRRETFENEYDRCDDVWRIDCFPEDPDEEKAWHRDPPYGTEGDPLSAIKLSDGDE
jgi:hypothetical protein